MWHRTSTRRSTCSSPRACSKKRKKVKTEEGEEKKKREPTAYNLLVKDRMSVIKEENPEMSRQDLMREVGRMWKEKKGDEKERERRK